MKSRRVSAIGFLPFLYLLVYIQPMHHFGLFGIVVAETGCGVFLAILFEYYK